MAARLTVLLLVTAFVASGCIGARRGPAITPAPTPLPSIPVAIDQTRLQVEGALRAAGHFLGRPSVPYRPPESPSLTTATRVVFQVLMADDPGHGQIVIYEFPDAARAAIAGREMAQYVASGPGRVRFPLESQFVLRQLGTTLIFYPWSRANSPTNEVEEIAIVLQSIGQEIDVPS